MAYILTGGVDIDNSTIKKDVLGRLYVNLDNSTILKDTTTGALYIPIDNSTITKNTTTGKLYVEPNNLIDASTILKNTTTGKIYVPIDNSTIKLDTTSGNLYADILMDNKTIIKNSNGMYSAQIIGTVNVDTQNQTSPVFKYINGVSTPSGLASTQYLVASSSTTFYISDYSTKNLCKTGTWSGALSSITNTSNMYDADVSTYATWTIPANTIQKIICDLGAVYTGYLATKISNPSTSYNWIRVEYSTDGSNYTVLWDGANGASLSLTFWKITARYIRITIGNNTTSTNYNFSVYDIAFFDINNPTIKKSGKIISLSDVLSYNVIFMEPQVNWYSFSPKM
jgi:hypothetical protein